MVRKRSEKAGLEPGIPAHTGEPRSEKPKLTAIVYDASELEEKELQTIVDVFPLREAPAVTWINVDGLHQVEVMEDLGKQLGLHPLVLERILNPQQRPMLEDLGEYLYIVLKMLDWNEDLAEMTIEQMSIVVGENYVASVQEHRGGDVLDPIRERIRTDEAKIRKQGPDYLAYAILDGVVDGYFEVLEGLGDRVEEVEQELMSNPSYEILQDLQHLKRQMVFERKAVFPLRDVLAGMERSESPLVQESTRVYLRDVYDHTVQVMDMVETLRDMLSGMLDIYLSSISNRLNEVMKVLTIFASIFAPLTFIAGVYGMNFRYLPELTWRWGYPAIWLVMLGVGLSMLWYFRRKGWL